MHVPPEELEARLSAAEALVTVGARYAHYKDETKVYTVRCIAFLESNDEPAVVYDADYGAQVSFVRPVSSWVEEVEKDGIRVPRFKKL